MSAPAQNGKYDGHWPEVGDIVQVFWEDIHSETAWVMLDEIEVKPRMCITLGYLVPEKCSRRYLVVAGSVHDYRSYADVVCIPRGNVHEVKTLLTKSSGYTKP